jgi:SAM-dependent methyltransferase
MAFVELVATSRDARVADVGCGPGRVAAYLAANGFDVIGIDVSRPVPGSGRLDAEAAVAFVSVIDPLGGLRDVAADEGRRRRARPALP